MGVHVLKLGSKGKPVIFLQKMLNFRGKLPKPIAESGIFDAQTKQAIQYFQRRWRLKPDGIVRADTVAALSKVVGPKAAPLAKAFGVDARHSRAGRDRQPGGKGGKTANKSLSGAAWFRANQAKYPNSNSVDDLAGGFRKSVRDFLDALAAAGADVTIEATRRDPNRAYLMYWCYMIAKGSAKPREVPRQSGVDIQWDHGDEQASKKAAQEMVKLFGIVHQPSLTSRHVEGKAIDMTIRWTGILDIRNKQAKAVAIKSSPRTGQNRELQTVGKTYGVIKLVSDPPHWSSDGK